MFDLSQLRCFVTVASKLSFSRAAQKLNMTQPPLTRKIQLLEHQLGIELFMRSTRHLALTEAGKFFFIEAQTLLISAQKLTLTAQKIAKGEKGKLALSFVTNALYDILPLLLKKLNTLILIYLLIFRK